MFHAALILFFSHSVFVIICDFWSVKGQKTMKERISNTLAKVLMLKQALMYISSKYKLY